MTESRKVSGVIVDEMTAAQQTLNALNELMGNEPDSIKYEKMVVEKDGVMIEVEIPIDDIDLLDDMDDDELTEEGERSLGIIDKDYDTSSGDSPKRSTRESMAYGTFTLVENDDTQDYVITCPYTGSTEVYQISSNVFASYETDQPFRVKIDEEG
jgi:hypothetical protein